jgi:four helix bundle protein
MSKLVKTYRNLEVYQMAFDGAMKIYEITKKFPKEEKYSMIDQIQRSSRSVCANLGESWRKRRYKLSFVSKLSDAETEAAETQIWLEFALHCGYIDENKYHGLTVLYDNIIGKIVRMIDNPEPWLLKSIANRETRRRTKS